MEVGGFRVVLIEKTAGISTDRERSHHPWREPNRSELTNIAEGVGFRGSFLRGSDKVAGTQSLFISRLPLLCSMGERAGFSHSGPASR